MKIFLAITAALVLSIVAVLAYAGYANHAAERAAQSFCTDTPVGSDPKLALARAQGQGVRYRGKRVIDGREEHDFQFQGWVFNAGVCTIAVENGKVLSAAAQMEGD